jgi:demethylmenaquinone methyltransferase/2-methoxy-6-polyprenyl-1,4-benzoquinol methylase
MSTYVLMRILESAPKRYELGIRLLTAGGVERAYERLASHVEPDQRVLDIGCGTGALTVRLARRGARVKGIDINAALLAIAAQHVRAAGVEDAVELAEMGVAELDRETAASYDAVACSLCLSELSDDENVYALAQAMRLLRPGGLLLVADEVKASGLIARLLRYLVRAPLAALTYAITQQTSHPIADLPGRLTRAGFELVAVRAGCLGDFVEIVARRPNGEAR